MGAGKLCHMMILEGMGAVPNQLLVPSAAITKYHKVLTAEMCCLEVLEAKWCWGCPQGHPLCEGAGEGSVPGPSPSFRWQHAVTSLCICVPVPPFF